MTGVTHSPSPTGIYDGSSRDRIAAFKVIEAACGRLAAAPKARAAKITART